MKKQFFLLAVFVLTAQIALAQGAFTVYTEDFNSGIPSSWLVVDNTSTRFLISNGGSSEPATWEAYTTSNGDDVVRIFGFNSSDPGQTTYSNDYLISESIDLDGFAGELNVVIYFSHIVDDGFGGQATAATNERLPVYAYTLSNPPIAPADTLALVDNGYLGLLGLVDGNSTPFQQQSLALPASFAGQTIYLAVRYLGAGAGDYYGPSGESDSADDLIGLAIDKIEVTATELGVDENQKLSLELYPNPVGERLHIRFSNAQAREAEVVLYNLLGKPVMRQTYTQGGVDVSRLAPGVYLAKINVGRKTETVKLIKQ